MLNKHKRLLLLLHILILVVLDMGMDLLLDMHKGLYL